MTNPAAIKERIDQLRLIQQTEERNNFANDNLWNECEDKIYFLKQYGQENEPSPLYDENGYQIGIVLENGNFIEWEGMTFENSYH